MDQKNLLQGLIAFGYKFLFGAVLFRIGLSLIALGVSLLIPGFWEIVINFVVEWANRCFPDARIPKYPIENGLISILLAVLLIGVGAFILRKAWHGARHPRISINREPSYIYADESQKDKPDPVVTTSINITIETGNEPVVVHSIAFLRYVQGCTMGPCGQTLRQTRSNEDIPFNDNKALAKPMRIAENSTEALWFQRKFVAPTRQYYFHELEDGQLEIVIHYRIGDDKKLTKDRVVFRQSNGQLTKIDEVSAPPWLNDNILKLALRNGDITNQDIELASQLNERERFIFLRDKEAILNSRPNVRANKALQELLVELHSRLD